jgi:hypothetical protein
LVKENPAVWRELVAGKYLSVNAGAKAAGFVKGKPTAWNESAKRGGQPRKAVGESMTAKREGRYTKVQELHASGLDAVQIARRLGLMPRSARQYLKELGLS